MKDTGKLNELWSKLVIKEFIHHGIRTFFIAPGSQSAPLTVAAASHPLTETIIHYDERGMAFHALGYAKGSVRPVALIVTSGSALGNLLPAVMEASHDHVPLILLTADRPPELKDTGADQTTIQTKIFQSFIRWECDLPCPDQKISQAFIGTTVAQGISHALSEPKGPVHFNCMYRKPLLKTDDSSSFSFHSSNRSMHRAETTISMGKYQIDKKIYEQIADELSEYEKGIILIGGTESLEDCEKIYVLSRLLQWPIFPDVLSHMRSKGRGSGAVPYYDLIIKTIGANEDYAPHAVLQLGDRFVSNKLMEWIALKKPKVHCHVSSHIERRDPVHSVTHRITTDLESFLKKIPYYLSGNPPSKWLEIWKELNLLTHKGIASYFLERSSISEPYIFYRLMNLEQPSISLFFSNGMSIRNGDAFFCPEKPFGSIYGNRGLSGIDGNIATIAGIAKGNGKPLIACIGDLAFLHDLNSLSLIKNLSIKLIVINNNGGDTFSFLPISQRKDVFKSYFRVPHNLSLKQAAALFGIEYRNPQTMSEFEKVLSFSGCIMIEVKTKGGENKQIHEEILMNLKEIQGRNDNCLIKF